MMVLAGPGSGKTFVITRRIQELVRLGVSPSHILVVTFTRAAARQMEERYLKLAGCGQGRPTFSTFHSLFFKIIQYAYGYQASNIIREDQRNAFMRELIKENGLDLQDEGEFISSVLSEISVVKGERLSLEHYYSSNCPEEVFKRLYKGYGGMMRDNSLIDFDDMQVYCYELFRERKDILGSWQRKFQYILVDEFQDICKTQYDVLKLLAGEQRNLFIVGDDDQAIYHFRGARPEIMLGFEKDFPGTKKVLLDVNFRCNGNIVESSKRLIAHNRVRFPKELRSARDMGKRVITRTFATALDQNRVIARELRDRLDQGKPMEEVGILFRTNRNAGPIVRQLMAVNVPFQMKDVTANLYEHWIARDILAYLSISHGDRQRGSFLRIANRPNRYISRGVFTESQVSFEGLYRAYGEKDWMVERIERLEYDLGMICRMSPYAAINYIRKTVGYEDYLAEYAAYRRMRPEELTDILEEIHENAKEWKTYEEWLTYIRKYGEELKNQRSRQEEKREGVVLMTMHGAKGLEYPVVYIADANEGVVPHKRASGDGDIEEERRLFYVAMTRAKDQLYVCCPLERYGKKQEISRFVKEYLPAAGKN